jgi:subtilisin family serine protease
MEGMRRSAVLVLLMAAALLAASASASNDPLFPRQWGLTQVQAPQAWSRSTGANTVIAVVDTGVDLGHPDLRTKVIAGRDFANNDNTPQDDHDHGTHVSGIAAATTGNGRGVGGVAPAAQILAIKVLESDGGGTSSDVAQGIRYAADRGSEVINLSLSELLPLSVTRSVQVDDAIRYATSRGSVVIAAAGNDAFPFADRETANIALLVGATGRSDTRASYSNSGVGVRIWAPGGDIVQGLFCDNDSGVWSSVRRGEGGCGQSHYHQFDGTSMAAPHVAGAAALIRSVNPSLTPAQVINILIKTSDRSRDGLPRLNAAKAVAATPRPGGGGSGGGAPPTGGGGAPSTGGGGSSSGGSTGSGGDGGAGSPQVAGSPQAQENSAASPPPETPGDRRSVAQPEEGGGFPFVLGGALVLLLLGAGGGAYWYVFARKRG